MTGKYETLEQYLRGLPVSQEDVTLAFTLIQQMLSEALPALRLSMLRPQGGAFKGES